MTIHLLPFAMRFEEHHHVQDQRTDLMYDDHEGLSYVVSASGEKVPYIMVMEEYLLNSIGTKALGESEPESSGTTVTKIRTEVTDYNMVVSNGPPESTTHTRVRTETTDEHVFYGFET